MLIITDIRKYNFSNSQLDYIEKANLIDNLEDLKGKGFIFRGHSNATHQLIPKAFRIEVIQKMNEIYGKAPSYCEWRKNEEYKNLVQLYLHTPDAIDRWEVKRIFELTLYLLKYNYGLANYIKQHPEKKFDPDTINNYKLRPPSFWKESFKYFFQWLLHQAIGIISLGGKVLKYGEINEVLAAYDETLPQHYDTPTASLDWSLDPYIAFYFAFRRSSHKFVSIYAYKEISNSEKNPIKIVRGNKDCENIRIERQMGLFTQLRYACAYYFFYGKWPSLERFAHKMPNNFELMKFDIPVEYKNGFQDLLTQKGLTEEFLFPDEIT